jgi:hypothetical protein
MSPWERVFRGQNAAAACLSALGIFILIEAVSLDYTSETGPGPGFLPHWLGITITCRSLLLIFTTIRKRPTSETIKLEPFTNSLRPLVIWIAMMVSISLLAVLGFYASFGVLAAFLVLILERRAVFTALAVALGSALGFYLIFTLLLRAPLPTGPWGF